MRPFSDMARCGALAAAIVLGLASTAPLAGDDQLDKLYLAKRKQVDEGVAGGFLLHAKAFELHKAQDRARILATQVVACGSPLQVKEAEKLLARIPANPGKADDADTDTKVEDAILKYQKAYEELISYCEKRNLAAEADDARAHMAACLACSAHAKRAEQGGAGASSGASTEDERCLERVNLYRKKAGLKPVKLDAKLSDGCRKHSSYLDANKGKPETDGLKAHTEDSSLAGYTEEGASAAKASDIISGRGAVEAVDAWIDSLYHRIPMLHPDLERIGFGGSKEGFSCLDVMSGRGSGSGAAIVVFPADGQTDVRTAFGNEFPDPLPPEAGGTSGYPITLTPWGKAVSSCEGKLEEELSTDPDPARGKKGDGEPKKSTWRGVPIYFFSPEKPPRTDFDNTEGTLSIFPCSPLGPGKRYRATFTYTEGGEKTTRVVIFSTG